MKGSQERNPFGCKTLWKEQNERVLTPNVSLQENAMLLWNLVTVENNFW